MDIKFTSVNTTLPLEDMPQTVLKAVAAARDRLAMAPENKQTAALRRQLCWGSVKRSKVDQVNSVATLMDLVSHLGPPLMTVLKPGTQNPLLRFALPSPYTAVTSITRLSDLGMERKRTGWGKAVYPSLIRESRGGQFEWVYNLHAPGEQPVKTEVVTFVLTPDFADLVEWFPGECPALRPPTEALESHWVHLGVDLEEAHFQKMQKKHEHRFTTRRQTGIKVGIDAPPPLTLDEAAA